MGMIKNIIYGAIAITVPVVGVALVGLLYDGDDPEV